MSPHLAQPPAGFKPAGGFLSALALLLLACTQPTQAKPPERPVTVTITQSLASHPAYGATPPKPDPEQGDQFWIDLSAYVDIRYTDSQRPPEGLAPEDFTATLSGQPLSVDDVQPLPDTGEGIGWVFLIDLASELDAEAFARLKERLSEWIAALQPADRAALILYDGQARLAQGWTDDIETLLAQIEPLATNPGPSALTEALALALDQGAKTDPLLPLRRVLVTLTDGLDDPAPPERQMEIARQLAEANLPLYAAGYSKTQPQGELRRLEGLAARSGGRYFDARTGKAENIFQNLGVAARLVYRIDLTCDDCDPGIARGPLEIALNDPEGRIATRRAPTLIAPPGDFDLPEPLQAEAADLSGEAVDEETAEEENPFSEFDAWADWDAADKDLIDEYLDQAYTAAEGNDFKTAKGKIDEAAKIGLAGNDLTNAKGYIRDLESDYQARLTEERARVAAERQEAAAVSSTVNGDQEVPEFPWVIVQVEMGCAFCSTNELHLSGGPPGVVFISNGSTNVGVHKGLKGLAGWYSWSATFGSSRRGCAGEIYITGKNQWVNVNVDSSCGSYKPPNHQY